MCVFVFVFGFMCFSPVNIPSAQLVTEAWRKSTNTNHAFKLNTFLLITKWFVWSYWYKYKRSTKAVVIVAAKNSRTDWCWNCWHADNHLVNPWIKIYIVIIHLNQHNIKRCYCRYCSYSANSMESFSFASHLIALIIKGSLCYFHGDTFKTEQNGVSSASVPLSPIPLLE